MKTRTQTSKQTMKTTLPGNHTKCRRKGALLGAWLAAITLLFWLGGPAPARAQTTANDGNWATKLVALTNTPQAAFMARVGDIDNMGFGWETGFDPFSGASTPAHDYPWVADPADPDGTDRIMVVTSYVGTPPFGQDGYSTFTERPDNSVRSIVLQYALPALTITNSVLQIFVDDFQAPVWGTVYQVTLNGRRASFLEPIINRLDQTGPIGKLITVIVPANFLNEVATGRLEFKFDDLTIGAGDGYSIDFIKLLVNAKSLLTGNISGKVRDAGTSLAIPGAKVVSFGITATTDSSGFYTLTNVPAGLAFVEASASGYAPTNQFADVLLGQTTTDVDFELQTAPLTLSIALAVELRFFAWSGMHYVLQFSSNVSPAQWYDDENITGAGAEVVEYRLVDAAHRFWRVKQN
jgi:hypothetical protein